jgi:hypothetical protein
VKVIKLLDARCVLRGIVILCALHFINSSGYAQAISSAELIKNAKEYDDKEVVFEGEVIGEVMPRGRYAWVNVHDGNRAIGIWMPYELSRKIKYAGSYKSRGDVIAVTGVFHQNCLEHGGDTDIHAQSMRVLRPGGIVSEKLNFAKRNHAIVLGGLCLLIWILTLLQRR